MSLKVGILMGSPNDKEKVAPAEEVLGRFGIQVDSHVMSAHRTPDDVTSFARAAKDEGYGVVICAAGMAAALPGAVAAHTTLPVIGLPLSGSALNGVDALYAAVQMPPGVPVACVAIDGAKNAGILAAQILALSDEGVAAKLVDFKAAGSK
jgi:5-(carboxyamino)imidazole ribonucleotide mutase